MNRKNKILAKFGFLILTALLGFFSNAQKDSINSLPTQLKPWTEGYLDIHHINTGRGDATFMLLPDGTTMMFDVGALEGGWAEECRPANRMQVTPVYPNNSKRPGQWIANYIKQVVPADFSNEIDYAVISHFHGDHYGMIHDKSVWSATEAYRLSGITDLYDEIPIVQIIDRGYPNYDFPKDLRSHNNKELNFVNYLRFLEYHVENNNLKVDSLNVGDSRQISLLSNPDEYDFMVMPIKSNGTIKDSLTNKPYQYMSKEDIVNEEGKFGENPMSIALKISYGDFDYYTGGDNTGVNTKQTTNGMDWWFDVETPMANAVGQVEVAVMDHHGVRDAMNQYFVDTLAPQVFVQQSITSDHPGQETFFRMYGLEPTPDFFATNIHNATMATYGGAFRRGYKIRQGHILIRVLPGGMEYYVLELDHLNPKLEVKNIFGPYKTF